ncbi:integrase core domain-containing protein [Salibaculum halophilum]|uniref:integrase core domain-containing protein n=1 Tax=Salibaculum halophilum TaxID=1914408 RepID=UPI0015C49102|nr:integrase core domain-containing protein [Salibaculum halophilum]
MTGRTPNMIDAIIKGACIIPVGRKRNATDIMDTPTDLFILRGSPSISRADKGPICIARKVPEQVAAVGAKFIAPGPPRENGLCENFADRLRNAELNGVTLRALRDARIPIEQWNVDYRVLPRSALG